MALHFIKFFRHLDRSTVLTAAHCVNFVDPVLRTYESRIIVHVGMHHNTERPNSNSYLVRKIIIVKYFVIFDHRPTNRRSHTKHNKSKSSMRTTTERT